MNLFLRFYVPVAVHLTSVDLVLTTSELSIRVRDSTATFVIKAIQPRKIVIDTSKLFIMVRESTVIFVKLHSHPIAVVIDTSELSIHQGEKIKECNLKVFIYYNILSN